MIENTLHIGQYQYLTQLYTEEDFGISERISSKFVMLRNFNIINDIINDTHIYIMSKEDWLNLCKEIDENKDNYQNGFDKVNSVVFPIQTTELTGYSSLYSEFNANFIRDSLYKKDENDNFIYGNDIYPILNDSGEELNVECYKLRIYHPSIISSLQSVITIDNHINGIHFYYLCNTVNKFKHYSETEIRKNNNIYSEYIEIIVPNIDFLFKQIGIENGKDKYNAYFDERLNTIISSKNENYINKMIIDEVERYYTLEFNIDIPTEPIINHTYYAYIGTEDPIMYKESFNNSQDLFTYIKNGSYQIIQDDQKIHILIPTKFKNDIKVYNVLKLTGLDDITIPVFEILCDEDTNNIDINGEEYTHLITRPKCKKIKLTGEHESDLNKSFYIGSVNPLTQIQNSHNIYDLDKTKGMYVEFTQIKEILDNNISTTRFIYSYKNWQTSNNNLYILIPSSYEDKLIFADNDLIDNFESIYSLKTNNVYNSSIKLSNDENNLDYTLLKLDNIANKNVRIYNINAKPLTTIYNIDDVQIINDREHNITNYINLQNQLIPLALLLQPYIITEDIDPLLNDVHNVKLYLKNHKTIENNYIMTPFNLSIYPYEYIDVNTGHYIYDDSLTLATIVYNIDCLFELNALFGFNETTHKASIITKFNYPNKDRFLINNNNDNKLALQNAYTYYNNIDIDVYKYFWVDMLLNIDIDYEQKFINAFDEICANDKLYYTPNGTLYVIINNKKYYNLLKKIDDDNYETINDISDKEKIKRLIDINYDNVWDIIKDWEIEEEYQTNMDFFGFRIQIATDLTFKNIIYNQTYSIDITDLDDFSFELNNIFESWYQLPNTLICSVTFIDHIVNKAITANNVIITKEYFKYLINDNNIYALDKINQYNQMLKEINLNDINSIDSPFNFINNINCVVNKELTNQTFTSKSENYIPKIIYQPIYFRTQDLQNIKLRTNVLQNIGINLGRYMSKVESFKIIIDGLTFIEKGRNDSYVIFEINSTLLPSLSGTYNIMNQDDQYISSGNWEKY